MMRYVLNIGRVLTVVGLAAGALGLSRSALAETITVVGWGGPSEKVFRQVMFQPFSQATGVKVVSETYSGEYAKIRAMVDSKSVSWDVVDVGGDAALQMCAEGSIEVIDWKKLGLDRVKIFNGDKYDCGVASGIAPTVVAYDKDRLPNGPKTVADLFDVKKFPGKRGLWKNARGNLEWALIADGVPLKDVYTVLGTPSGVDRAFRKLDAIKNDVIWWTAGAQPMQLLADNQVVMTAAWSTRVFDAVKNSGKNFEAVWDGATIGGGYWVIPKGSPRLDDAYKFIGFAVSPRVQASVALQLAYPPGNRDAYAMIDTKVLPNLPNDNRMRNALPLDFGFWADHSDLHQRFSAWLAK
ncbi:MULTISPECIES: ABC transporter substrate-binding protein [Bradyrhizobium]|uniref:ABC transporter substrate-binding protein n=1 Tax=Bradyrhizobium centrosematis TaxID=1300039 RepID=UPI0021691D5C|nr:ABC transporter substrate-binding protein [Bradyrhizobium centrosematis]MCS3765917.1 putative spermidine/putrescine transport system substrate-binding protein [Bradyrhizobium centrosematis]MCS3778251.1 putative spermidine/putrescine transport system substrate-binding protein [Bradyrhizobium centrosematis]